VIAALKPIDCTHRAIGGKAACRVRLRDLSMHV
jgi:hypothetical protein